MIDNPVLKAIFDRRSIRRFTTEPVTREEIGLVLEAGRWAPSGLNNQPWRFLPMAEDDPRQEELARLTKYKHIVKAARALIVVLLDKNQMYHQAKDNQSSGAAIQNMLLAAHALGLGAVWLGEILKNEEFVLEILGLDPADYELQAVIAMGRPAQKGNSTRKPMTELLLEEL